MTGVMALRGASKVFVFEPLPTNQYALKRLRECNPKLPIEILPVAIGNTSEETSLKVMPDNSMAKLGRSTFQPSATAISELRVAVHRIDDLISQGIALPPNLIKIDVEGAELEVLEGGAEMLRTARPLVFLEAHSPVLEQACCGMLRRLEYEPYLL